MTAKDILTEIVKKAGASTALATDLKGMEKSFQFSTTEGSKFYVKISGGNIDLSDGEIQKPTAVVSGSDSTLETLFMGKLDPVKAFMSGQIKVSGDIFSAQKLTDIIKKAGK